MPIRLGVRKKTMFDGDVATAMPIGSSALDHHNEKREIGVMLYFLLYLVVAVGVFIDANKRGLNGIVWGVLTAGFGPLVAPWYLATRPVLPMDEPRVNCTPWNFFLYFLPFWSTTCVIFGVYIADGMYAPPTPPDAFSATVIMTFLLWIVPVGIAAGIGFGVKRLKISSQIAKAATGVSALCLVLLLCQACGKQAASPQELASLKGDALKEALLKDWGDALLASEDPGPAKSGVTKHTLRDAYNALQKALPVPLTAEQMQKREDEANEKAMAGLSSDMKRAVANKLEEIKAKQTPRPLPPKTVLGIQIAGTGELEMGWKNEESQCGVAFELQEADKFGPGQPALAIVKLMTVYSLETNPLGQKKEGPEAQKMLDNIIGGMSMRDVEARGLMDSVAKDTFSGTPFEQ